MKTGLIAFPILILLVLTAFSISGLGSTGADASTGFGLYNVNTSTDADGNLLYLYDSGGHAVCYWNGTATGETGSLIKNAYTADAVWRNETSAYAVYYDTGGEDVVKWADCSSSLGLIGDSSGISASNTQFTFTDSLSWSALIIVIMGIGALAGFKFFGSGESEISVNLLLKGTFFLTIWAVLTALAYPLILQGGYLVYIFYFGLSLTYTIGIVSAVE